MILVVGATGSLGGAIARNLLVDGKPVRILARPHSNYYPLEQAGAQVVMGDMKDPASLIPACAGVSTIITTANAILRGGEDTIESVDRIGNRNLIDAAREAGVKHFIFVSVLGASTDTLDPFVRAKAESEAHLAASGMTFTIIAPNAFMEVWPPMIVGMPALQGIPVMIYGGGSRKHTFISAGDVAAFTIAAVDHPAAQNQLLPLGGPEALSWRDVIALYERVLGHPVAAEFVPPGTPIPYLPPPVVGLFAGMDLFDTMIDTTDLANTFRVQLTPLEDVIRRMLQPAHA